MRSVRLAVVVLMLGAVVYAQKAAKIDKLVSGLASSGHFSGQVTASENGKIIYDKAFGTANADFKIPNALNTRIGIASITKPMTSVMIKPGCRHRAVGRLKILNIAIPKFDPHDEWFD